MAKPKVVLTRRWPKACEDKASELFDAKINRDDKPMSVAELQDALRSVRNLAGAFVNSSLHGAPQK